MLRLPVDPSIWRISHFPAKVPFSARRLLSSAAFAQKITEQKKFLLTLQFLSCMLHGNKALSSKDCLLSTDCWRTDIDPNQAIMIPYYISQSYPISNFFLLQRRNFYSCCSRSLLLCNCWLDTSWYAGKTTKKLDPFMKPMYYTAKDYEDEKLASASTTWTVIVSSLSQSHSFIRPWLTITQDMKDSIVCITYKYKL